MKTIIRETLRAAFAAIFLLCLTTAAVVFASGGGAGGAAVVSALTGLVTGDRLTLTSTSGTSLTVTGQGTGSGAVVTGGASGYGIAVSGNATKSAISMTPQSNPSSGAIGDLTMFTGGYLRVAAATTPTFEEVGSFLTPTTATAFATGGQGSATTVCNNSPLTALTTVASAGDSVKFPASATVGKICKIHNKAANSANLFPASGGSLCVVGGACLGTNTATPVAGNTAIECWHQGGAVWNCR